MICLAINGRMRICRAAFFLGLLLLLGRIAGAQTACATRHTGAGVFICYPNSSENGADSIVPDIFHLSAQGNAIDGRTLAGYKVMIDNRVIYEKNFPAPLHRLSIEINLKSPFDSGSHTLKLAIADAGLAEVKELRFYPARNISFCDPFSRADARVCSLSNIRPPLQWSLNATQGTPTAGSFQPFSAYAQLYGRNLKSVEADISDAMAVDTKGNLYVASHAFADINLYKYAPNGSLVYARLIPSCGNGFLSVTGLAVDNAGRAWIAGNTTACLSTTPDALQSHISDFSRPRGFVILVDTTKPTSIAPLYATYLSGVDNRISAIRVDDNGNAFVIGTTTSLEFPHNSSLRVDGRSFSQFQGRLGFVSVLNPLGSGLQWSTLLQNVQLTSLALDGMGDVYVTGSVAPREFATRVPDPADPAIQSGGARDKVRAGRDDVLVAKISDRGRRLSYVARFGGSADDEGQAISVTAQGRLIFVAGDTNSPDFSTSPVTHTSAPGRLRSFAVSLQPCQAGAGNSRILTEIDNRSVPGIALSPALDAFTDGFARAFTSSGIETRQKPLASVQIAPTCPSSP